MGLNESERLKENGIAARKGSVTKVPLDSVLVPVKGDVAHPRWTLPLDESLIQHIMKNGVPGRLTVREAGLVDDVMQLQLCDGSRRTKNGLEAQRRLQETAPRRFPLVWNKDDPKDRGIIYADIDMFHGTDAEFLLERLRTNSEPGKLPDSIEVLAATVKQLAKLGFEDLDAITAVMPRGVGKKEVQALGRFDNLVPAVRKRFINEDLPVGLLPAVVDAARDEQENVLNLLVAKGITSSKGATRTLNTKREQATGAPRPRKFTPKKLKAIAKMVAPAMAVRVCFDSEEANYSEREMEIFKGGFAAAANLFAGQKTGALPAEITTIIKEVAKGLPGKGKAKAESAPSDDAE